MIYGACSRTIYLQKRSLEYTEFSDDSLHVWTKLHRTIPEIIGTSFTKWTSPNVLVEWDNG